MQKEKTSWLFVFMTGFVIGVLLINFWDKAENVEEGLVSLYTLERLKYFEIDNGKLFWYVLEERLKVLFLLALLSTTILGIATVYCYMAWLGLSLGALLATMTLRFGMKGILLFGACAFPQYVLYIPLMAFFIHWCYGLCVRIHFPHKDYRGGLGNRKQQILRMLLQLTLLILGFLLGIVLECYISPVFLHKIIKFF